MMDTSDWPKALYNDESNDWAVTTRALTSPIANGSFASTRDSPRKIILTGEGKPPRPADSRLADLQPSDLRSADLCRREFLVRFCQGAGACLIPASLWAFAAPNSRSFASRSEPAAAAGGFHLHPHYRTERPLDNTMLKVQAGSDEFISEKYADQIAEILTSWSAGLLRSPGETKAVANALATEFSGAALQPTESR